MTRRVLIQKKGFTLIELVVVFVVIGLLAALVMPNFLTYRYKIRNEVRRAHLQELQIALEQYYAKYKQYPSTCVVGGFVSNTGVGLCPTVLNNQYWFYSHPSNPFQRTNSGNWIPALVSSGFYPRALPVDPRANLFPTQTDVTCTASRRVTYRYKSTGVHYKLQALCGPEGPVILSSDDMYNPASLEPTERSYVVTDIPLSPVDIGPGLQVPETLYCGAISGTQGPDFFDSPKCW